MFQINLKEKYIQKQIIIYMIKIPNKIWIKFLKQKVIIIEMKIIIKKKQKQSSRKERLYKPVCWDNADIKKIKL